MTQTTTTNAKDQAMLTATITIGFEGYNVRTFTKKFFSLAQADAYVRKLVATSGKKVRISF